MLQITRMLPAVLVSMFGLPLLAFLNLEEEREGIALIAMTVTVAGTLVAMPFIHCCQRRNWLELKHFVLLGAVGGALLPLLAVPVIGTDGILVLMAALAIPGALHGWVIWLVAFQHGIPVRGPSRNGALMGLALAVLYGVLLRGIFAKVMPFGIALVSVAFFFLGPFVIGFLRVQYEMREQGEIAAGRAAVVAWQPIFVFLLLTFVTGLEGSICILLALPAFLLIASLGGLLGRRDYLKYKNSVVGSLALLPLFAAPVESLLPPAGNVYEVRNSVVIAAPPEAVWNELGNVADIAADEVPLGITRLVGIPRPLRAEMSGGSVGAVRTSIWEKGVEFRERITAWEPGVRMAYDFEIDPALIPDSALDAHVKLGGEFFAPLRGQYELASSDGLTTTLTLSTVVEDNTHFGIYSRIWGEVIFRDFHASLLEMLRRRAEAEL